MLIQNNPHFLSLNKTLLEHGVPSCEVTGISKIKKIGIFDEIKFNCDMHRIRFVSMSSEIDNNYMMVAIDGTVYKYDIATKEMLFSFKTVH